MKIFIAGPRATKDLSTTVKNYLSRIIDKKSTVLLGDAAGVDKLVQKYLASYKYQNVFIYASDGKVRNNIGNWPVLKVDVPKKLKGFQFYIQKDIKMAQDADLGFMIWNGKSKGTLNNIINLTNQNKKALIYLVQEEKMVATQTPDDVEHVTKQLGKESYLVFEELRNINANNPAHDDYSIQLTMLNHFDDKLNL